MRLIFELLYTFKLLKRNLTFSILCITVISLGLGISLVLYSLAENLALKTLPFAKGDRFVVGLFSELEVSSVGFDYNDRFDAYRLQHFKDNTSSYYAVGGMRALGLNISDGESAEAFIGNEIEPALLEATDTLPLLGRLLQKEDSRNDAAPVVLINYSLWQSYYSGRENIIGHQSKINGEFYTIVGVMPEGFSFPGVNDALLPLHLPVTPQPGAGPANITAVGVLAEGVSLASANTEFFILNQNFQAQEAASYEVAYAASIEPYIQGMAWGDEFILPITVGATIMIMLLIIFNISNLFMVRSQERVQELAIRSSVGASRGRMIEAIMLESLLVSFIGTLIGLGLAHFCLGLVETALVSGFGRLSPYLSLGLNLNLVSSAVIMCALVWIGSGILPALRVSDHNINQVLAESSKGTMSKGSIGFTRFLVNLQVVVCCFLLLVTGCLVQYLKGSKDVDLGIEQNNYLTAEVLLTTQNYETPPQRQQYYESLSTELMLQAGISQATVASTLPGTATNPGSQTIPYVPYNLEDRDLLDAANDSYPFQYLISVEGNYFNFFGAQLLSGRQFDAGDTADSLAVVVVDELFAGSRWPDESPLGKRIQINPKEAGEWFTIVGVVSFIRHDSPVIGPDSFNSTLFRPISQSTPRQLHIAVQVDNPLLNYIDTFKQAAAKVDRDIPITAILPFDKVLENITSFAFLMSNIFVMVAAIALLVAGCGIYGVMARSANRRMGEIGIRRAVGANNTGMVNLFLREGAFILVLGLVIGGLPALYAVYGIATAVPVMLDYLLVASLIVITLLTIIVLLASYIPAKKLVALEPGDALRYE